MPPTHLVVDGSNIATEGRSLPSLRQLLEAVDAVTEEFDHANVTVIVDATFGHRIDASEREQYEEKVNSGQIITPPAGVIGRGDAFILEVADRADAIILSNDSFQEFHGTYDWLFTEGRLLGGKHVPGVGWIFLARSPVRGPTSRRAVSDAKRKRRGSKTAASKTPASKRPAASASKASKSSQSGPAAKASSRSTGRGRSKAPTDEPAGRKRGGKEPEPYNEPLPFIEFVGAHPVGSVIEAEIEQFASHGAYVVCDGTRCYISLKSISDPPPRSAREVLELGETREFVVKAIDTPRRGIDLAMPGMDLTVTDEQPGDDDVELDEVDVVPESTPAERVLVAAQAPTDDDGDRKLSVSQRRKLRAQQQADAEVAAAAAAEAAAAPVKKAAATRARAAAKKAAPDQKATDRKATSDMATKKAASKKKPAAKKAVTKKKAAPAKKAAVKKATPASRATKSTTKKAAAKKATTKKATTKKAAAKKATTKKAAAKKSTTKKAAAKKSTTKKAAAKKSTTKKAAAKRSTTKKAATKRA